MTVVSSIRKWSSSHSLKLNASKSEVIWLGSRQRLTKLSADDRTLILPDGALEPTTVVKNIGVYVDEKKTMDSNARQCVKTSFYHMRRIRQIRRFVNADTLHMLVRALIL